MHKEGADIEFISRVVNLSKEEVEKIINTQEKNKKS